MENAKIDVVGMVVNTHGGSLKPGEKTADRSYMGPIERKEMKRAKIIDHNLTVRCNIERDWKNYLYF